MYLESFFGIFLINVAKGLTNILFMPGSLHLPNIKDPNKAVLWDLSGDLRTIPEHGMEKMVWRWYGKKT